MYELTFDTNTVERLLTHARTSKEHKALYEDETTKKPGLWLVGDDGIYLMSNGRPALPRDEEAAQRQKDGEDFFKNLVAYADQCNPDKTEDVWDVKREIFGGDDGVEFIEVPETAVDIEKIEISPQSFVIHWLHEEPAALSKN